MGSRGSEQRSGGGVPACEDGHDDGQARNGEERPGDDGSSCKPETLLFFIPPDRRILCLEDVREIWAPQRDFLVHKTSPQQGIHMQDLIHSSLRETPDRVVIGEVRTPEEIKAFLELAQAGPGEGSYATFHGETLETAILRLAHHGISRVDLSGAIHALVLIKRRRVYDKKLGKDADLRYVAEIAEITDETIGDAQTLKKIFVYNQSKKVLMKQCPTLLEKEYGQMFGLTEKKTAQELEIRKRMLERLSKKSLTSAKLFEKMKEFYTTL